MNDRIIVQAMVISSMPIGEYDRRLLLLTDELGKISAFIKGGRRIASPLLGAGRLFGFGRFELFAGRSSYSVKAAEIKEGFDFLSEDPEALCYASYFAELADYYGQEGSGDALLLKLLYMAVRSLKNPNLNRALLRYAFELKLIQIQGEAPAEPETELDASAEKAWHFVRDQELEKCFLFTLKPEAFRDFAQAVSRLRTEKIDRHFRSLTVLEDFIRLKEEMSRQ